MSYIGPFTQNIINLCIEEFKKKDTKDKISKYIIDPVIIEVYSRLYHYYVLIVVLQIIIIFILLYIIVNKRMN